MRKLHIMSGLPASGKSTYCEKHGRTNGDIVIHRDEVRNHLRELLGSDEYFPCSPDEEYAFYMGYIRTAANASKKDIWIDQTTLSEGALKKLILALDAWIDIKVFDIQIEVLETPFDVCVERNSKREGYQCVPEDVMKSMNRGFNIPDGRYLNTVMPACVKGRITVHRILKEE